MSSADNRSLQSDCFRAMDSIKESRDNSTRQLQSAADSAAEFLDDGLATATHAAKQSVAIVRTNAEQAMEVGQVRCFPLVLCHDLDIEPRDCMISEAPS